MFELLRLVDKEIKKIMRPNTNTPSNINPIIHTSGIWIIRPTINSINPPSKNNTGILNKNTAILWICCVLLGLFTLLYLFFLVLFFLTIDVLIPLLVGTAEL